MTSCAQDSFMEEWTKRMMEESLEPEILPEPDPLIVAMEEVVWLNEVTEEMFRLHRADSKASKSKQI